MRRAWSQCARYRRTMCERKMVVWLRALSDGWRAAVDEANLHVAAGFGRLHASRLPAPRLLHRTNYSVTSLFDAFAPSCLLCLLVAWAAVNQHPPRGSPVLVRSHGPGVERGMTRKELALLLVSTILILLRCARKTSCAMVPHVHTWLISRLQ